MVESARESVVLPELQSGEFPVEGVGDAPLVEPHDKIDKEEYDGTAARRF